MPHLSSHVGPSYEPLRRLFADHGFPGLGPQRREQAMAVSQVTQVIDEALHGSPEPLHARWLALALCWHDHWEESHAVCQSHEGDRDVDFVHMVLHRREPDVANCHYWINHAGWHPLYNDLPAIAAAQGLVDLAPAGRWSPERFLDRCVGATATDLHALVAMQAAELLALRDRLLVTSDDV